MSAVYAVLWQYHDRSASGVVSVMATKERADSLVKCLREMSSDKEFVVDGPILVDDLHPREDPWADPKQKEAT